jgi:hypothetical protein
LKKHTDQEMMKAQNVVETNLGKGREAAGQAVAAMIRESSEAGQLIAESEILRRVADQHLLTLPASEAAEEAGRILSKGLDGSGDLHELFAQDGTRRYYSFHFMTEAYATILLRKQGDPLRLIAETVRENSAAYPRPVPMDIFTQPPFAFSREEVFQYLERMAAEEEYRDIVPTTTSASRMFLYSTIHLEADYASMLAEWIDVGQLENP